MPSSQLHSLAYYNFVKQAIIEKLKVTPSSESAKTFNAAKPIKT